METFSQLKFTPLKWLHLVSNCQTNKPQNNWTPVNVAHKDINLELQSLLFHCPWDTTLILTHNIKHSNFWISPSFKIQILSMFTLFKTSKVSFKAPNFSKNYKKPLRVSIKYKKSFIYFLLQEERTRNRHNETKAKLNSNCEMTDAWRSSSSGYWRPRQFHLSGPATPQHMDLAL